MVLAGCISSEVKSAKQVTVAQDEVAKQEAKVDNTMVELEKVEKKPQIGKYMNHQIIISRFLSSNTQYKGLLLMHEPGTGKTCSSVSTIERIRSETNSYKKALVIMKGQNLINNYVNELALVCTCKEKDEKGQCVEGPYVPKDYDLLKILTLCYSRNGNLITFSI